MPAKCILPPFFQPLAAILPTVLCQQSRASPFWLLIDLISQSCGVVYNRMICISFFFIIMSERARDPSL